MTLSITPHISFFAIFLLAGCLQGMLLFLSLSGVLPKDIRTISHRILGILVLVLSIELIAEFLYETGYQLIIQQLIYLEVSLDFLYGPLVYLYTVSLVSHSAFRLRRAHGLHFVPFIICLGLLSPMLLMSKPLLVAFSYDLVTSTQLEGLDAMMTGLANVAIVQMAIYLGLSINLLYRHQRWAGDTFSNVSKVSLSWLMYLLAYLSIAYGIYLLQSMAELFFEQDFLLEEATYIAIVVVLYALAYKGLNQPLLFSPSEPEPTRTNEPTNSKYAKSAITHEQVNTLLADLQRYMTENKPYLNGDLTLVQLADTLGLSTNNLSQVINDGLKTNFYHFVNQYRVDEIKRLLLDTSLQSKTVTELALAAGFNSKSAFYKAFKKATGMTPNQYKMKNSE